MYFSNKTENEVELNSDFLEKSITVDNIDYKFKLGGSSSYLLAKEEQGLYASFGRTRFNKERYDDQNTPTLEYVSDASLDLQSYNIAAFSMGYIKISLEKSTSVNHSNSNTQTQFANPNPVGDFLYLNAAFEQGPSSIHVYDANGREIQLRKKTLNGVVQMETGSISKGVFFVQLNNQMKNSVYRFIKE